MSYDYELSCQERNVAFYKRGSKRRSEVPILDKLTRLPNGESRGQYSIEFSRNDNDRATPKKSVTRLLMGDPKPGRTPWATA